MHVSVIIPNYNHSKFLKQRIDTVLNQTFQDFEVILLDDCSTDNSKEVIEQYRSHPKVEHLVYNTVNSGSVFRQWEKGISLARGKYIWIAESDDYAMPEFLSILIPTLNADESIGFAFSDSYCHTIKQNSEAETIKYSELRNELFQTKKWDSSYINDGRKEMEECLLKKCTVNNASAVLFRKSALLEVNPFDIQFKYFGDWYCYLKMCMRFKICYVNNPLNHYRDHSENASKRLMHQFSFIEEYFKIYNWEIKNVTFVDKEILIDRFRIETDHPLRSSWNKKRLQLYNRLFFINPYLFVKMFENNTKHLIDRLTKLGFSKH